MGWTYNTPDDVANEGPQITAIAIVFTAVSLLVLTLRFYVRGCITKAIGAGKSDGTELFLDIQLTHLSLLDDWILVVTWVSNSTLCCSRGTDNCADSILWLRRCDYRSYVSCTVSATSRLTAQY